MSEIEFKQRADDNSGAVSTGLRENWPVDRSGESDTFSVPEDLSAAKLERLIEAGHRPLDPSRLPSGVTYDNDGNAESESSGSESGSDDGAADDTSEADASEESGEEAPEVDVTEEALDEMNRPELYNLGNEEFGKEWEWGGEDALSGEEMRAELKEEL